jgi:hypothetical protein
LRERLQAIENKEHPTLPERWNEVVPSPPRKDRKREMREAVVENADKTEGKDRDLCTAMAGRKGSTQAKI